MNNDGSSWKAQLSFVITSPFIQRRSTSAACCLRHSLQLRHRPCDVSNIEGSCWLLTFSVHEWKPLLCVFTTYVHLHFPSVSRLNFISVKVNKRVEYLHKKWFPNLWLNFGLFILCSQPCFYPIYILRFTFSYQCTKCIDWINQMGVSYY